MFQTRSRSTAAIGAKPLPRATAQLNRRNRPDATCKQQENSGTVEADPADRPIISFKEADKENPGEKRGEAGGSD